MRYAHCDWLLIRLGYRRGPALNLAETADSMNLKFRSSDCDEDKYMVCACTHIDTGNMGQTRIDQLGLFDIINDCVSFGEDIGFIALLNLQYMCHIHSSIPAQDVMRHCHE